MSYEETKQREEVACQLADELQAKLTEATEDLVEERRGHKELREVFDERVQHNHQLTAELNDLRPRYFKYCEVE